MCAAPVTPDAPSTTVVPSAAPAPVLRPAKYLVCVDDTDASAVAVRFACMKAHKRGGQVLALHVVEPADFQSLLAVADKMREDLHQHAQEVLDKIVASVADLEGLALETLIREGKVEEEILTVATSDPDINMLVFGVEPDPARRGRRAAKLIAQLGDDLLVPMMLVPGNLTNQQIRELS